MNVSFYCFSIDINQEPAMFQPCAKSHNTKMKTFPYRNFESNKQTYHLANTDIKVSKWESKHGMAIA